MEIVESLYTLQHEPEIIVIQYKLVRAIYLLLIFPFNWKFTASILKVKTFFNRLPFRTCLNLKKGPTRYYASVSQVEENKQIL